MTQLTKFPKDRFLTLIASGYTEPRALKELGVADGILSLLILRDSEFSEQLSEAKRKRGDVFYEKIVDTVDNVFEKDEIPAAKLRIDTLKYLAAIDNPDKYSEKVKHQHDVRINIFQEIKDLPAAEMKRILTTVDPFAVDAEFVEVESREIEDDDDLEDLL